MKYLIILLLILAGCTQIEDCNKGPVCGKIQVQCITTPCDPVEQTFKNECEANEKKAFDIKKGPCNPISNFQECIDAGYPAMESYPRQCRDIITDRTFTEVI